MSVAPPDANEVGEFPSRFGEVRRLGVGAEGGAFAAVDTATGARVVLKRVEPTRLAAVRHAFGVLRRVASPHLPAVRELVRAEDGSNWLVTDWVEGRVLGPGPVLPVEAAAQGLAVAHALAAIHAAGTHHGDVSTANVVVTPTRGVMLIDLGQLGRLGTGTPGFIAPEVLAGGGGPAADRFALGCLLSARLFGETPWRRPEEVLGVDGDAVRTRLQVLARGRSVPGAMLDLLERLLAPDPRARPYATELVVERLARIVGSGQAGVDLRPGTTWWLPSRWPYHGAPLESLVDRLEARPRLVAIAGPPGAGRGRVVEELVQELQARGSDAALYDPRGTARAHDEAVDVAVWLEAWTAADDRVLGMPAPIGFPPTVHHPGMQLAVLRAALDAPGSTMIVPVSPELGAALRDLTDERIVVHEIEPWPVAEVERVLEPVLDSRERASWAGALHRCTGGWPARVIRAASACAATELEQPRAAEIEHALRVDATLGSVTDAATARTILAGCWDPTSFEPGSLPAHLHDGTAPLPTAIAAARAVLGDDACELAISMLETLRTDGRAPSLLLAVDAEAPAEVDRLVEGGTLRPGERAAAALVQWLQTGAGSRVHPHTRAVGARLLLADGDAEAALRVARDGVEAAVCAVEEARALQRLGHIDDALAVLESATRSRDDDVRGRALGLRWRLLVDAGSAEQALAEARARTRDAGTGEGAATARLWWGYAALVSGHLDEAVTRLHEAEAALEGVGGPGADGIRARVTQLLGNLAHDRGDLPGAFAAFSRAAEAFVHAGEAIGGLALRGSLAALAIPMADTRAGIEHGRAAVRGLLARGQTSALETAALALVQLLGRIGALDEATTLVSLVEDALAAHQTDLGRARLLRMKAELSAIALVTEATHGAPRQRIGDRRREAEEAHAHAARMLERADVPREALDAWIRAAVMARADERFAPARAHLAQAHALLQRTVDESARLVTWIESLRLAAATRDRDAMTRAEEALHQLPGVDALVSSGRIELAWTYDQALLQAARVRLEPAEPARRALARHALQTLEAIMKKTPSLDRPAVRAAFTVDAGQTGALRDLLAELDETGLGRGTPKSVPSHEPEPSRAARLERLLRIYRRLAREDRLEPLLEQVIDAVMDLTDAERGAVVLRGEGEARLEVTRELAGTEGAKFSRSVIDRVLESGDAVLSVDAAQDERFDQSRSISHLNLRSVLAVPLRFRGAVLGAIYVDHRLRRGNFGDDDLAHVEAFADLAALAVAHARALSEVRAHTETLEEQRAELAALLEAREVEVAGLREEVRAAVPERKTYRGIVGAATGMQEVYRLVDRLAESDVPVVIHGESGTGKELVARAIHDAGPRAHKPFVAENCGAIPETLLESVLFGHAKGAFTGAQKARAGLFEAASSGTIFLDEVGEMSPSMQTKLLRVLQEGEVRRIGESSPRPVDVRVIAASNRDLDAMVEAGTFRRDLYYRIHVVKLSLPPLRERADDIPALVRHFLERHANGRELEFDPAALRALRTYAWPGNVRELENEVQRWVALCEGTVVEHDLSPAIRGRSDELDPDDLQIRPRVDRLERELIARALERTEGNQTKAAELLGLSRFGLQKKLRRLTEEEA